jgi:ATP-dependent Lhr-like helicase
MTPGGADGAGSRVGELDEEMVYESRVGDAILLGTSSWRVEDITHDRVIVTPAPGVPARLPFWKGESIGRPLELGRAVGAFVREMSGLADDAARERAAAAGLDRWAVDNLLAYLHEQRDATRHVPSDRTILVERFRDELGDWRLVVHSPFGSQVNGPWALAIAARMRERRGVECQASAGDDGIVLRLPDAVDDSGAEVVPTAEDVLLDPAEVEQIVVAELGGSSLYASRFRECAARALLLPRRDPRRRSPLWQQRQKASQLLAVAGGTSSSRSRLEAMRECVQDVYDLPGLRQLMSDVQGRAVQVVEVATPAPSPFARSLLFGYIGMFLYEADAPLAERRAAALSLDSTLLAELLGSEAIRELLDPEVLAEVEASLQRLVPERHARDAEGAADLLRFLGDLSAAETAARGVREEWLRELEAARRAIRVRIAGEERWLAVEDAGRVRDALGAALPVGVPETFTEPVADPLGDLVLRWARTHGPFPAAALAARFGLGVAVVTGVLDRLVGSGRLVRGELRPAGEGVDYCDAEVLRRLRRGSLARLRAEVEPVEQRALGRFLPAWQGVRAGQEKGGRMRRAPGAEDVLGVVEQLAGAPVPASALESLILPARLPGYTPALLDELTAAGEVSWTGAGGAGRVGRVDRAGPGRRRRPAAARARGRAAGHAPAPRRARTRSRAAGRCSSASWPTAPVARCWRRRSPRPPTTRWWRRCGTWCGPGWWRATPSGRCAPGWPVAAAPERGAGRRTAPGARPRAAGTPSCGPVARRCPAAAARRRWAAGGRSRPSASPTPRAAPTHGPRRSWSGTACSRAGRWARSA